MLRDSKVETVDKKIIDCHICGICCEFLSISSLNKQADVRCEFLMDDNKCSDYKNRPIVCREYKADLLCYFISSLDHDEQVKIFKSVYGDI